MINAAHCSPLAGQCQVVTSFSGNFSFSDDIEAA